MSLTVEEYKELIMLLHLELDDIIKKTGLLSEEEAMHSFKENAEFWNTIKLLWDSLRS